MTKVDVECRLVLISGKLSILKFNQLYVFEFHTLNNPKYFLIDLI